MSGDEKRRKRERAARLGDDAEAERLSAEDARVGRAPMIRLRLEDVATIAVLEDERDLGEVLHDLIQLGARARREGWAARIGGEKRTAREALALATYALAIASADQARAVTTVLREGAGHLPLPDGATLSSPSGLAPERREAWMVVAESIRIETVGVDGRWDDDAIWTPVASGEWESVLTSLLVERRWEQIEATARELEFQGYRTQARELPDPEDA